MTTESVEPEFVVPMNSVKYRKYVSIESGFHCFAVSENIQKLGAKPGFVPSVLQVCNFEISNTFQLYLFLYEFISITQLCSSKSNSNEKNTVIGARSIL